MLRSLFLVLIAALAFTWGPSAVTQAQDNRRLPQYTAPEGVEMEILLYPITRFRGNRQRHTESDDRISGAVSVESIYVVRGIWLLCSEQFYYGRCVRVSGSQEAVNPPFPVRSIMLVGDTGPTFVEAPLDRFGSDVPVTTTTMLGSGTRAEATPVVAPATGEGGVSGTNPRLAGRAVEFFAAPAAGGNRVLACSQIAGGEPPPRCLQAAADGFCQSVGYRDSAWREFELIGSRSYLVNVLCKQADDTEGARTGAGFSLPFF